MIDLRIKKHLQVTTNGKQTTRANISFILIMKMITELKRINLKTFYTISLGILCNKSSCYGLKAILTHYTELFKQQGWISPVSRGTWLAQCRYPSIRLGLKGNRSCYTSAYN